MITFYAEYDPENPPAVYSGYPSGQELLIELCNLNLELRDKPLEECAQILIRWSLENIHPCYFYGDGVSHPEWNQDDPASYCGTLECQSVRNRSKAKGYYYRRK